MEAAAQGGGFEVETSWVQERLLNCRSKVNCLGVKTTRFQQMRGSKVATARTPVELRSYTKPVIGQLPSFPKHTFE